MRTLRIQTKMILGIIAVTLFFGLATVFIAGTVLQHTLDEKLEKRAVTIAKNIAQVSINPLLTEKYFELNMMVMDYKTSEEDIEYIYILNGKGDVVAHTFKHGFPVELRGANKPDPERQFSFQHYDSERGSIGDIAVPLLKGVAGTLHIGFSEKSITKDVDEIVRIISWIIIAGLAVATIVAIGIARAISKPVAELSRAAQAVERGNLDLQVAVRSHDEIGLLGAAFNDMVAAWKRSEEDVKKSEKTLRDITASIGEGVLVLNERGRLEFMNPEAERLLGWSAQELLGEELHELIHNHTAEGQILPSTECASLRVLKTGKRASIDDDLFIRKDGTAFPVSYISAPIMDGETVVAAVIAFHDITERKQAEHEREQLILEHMDALTKIKTLSGMLPICSSCKRIRDDAGYWTQIETYLNEHSEAEFSHGMCPECAAKMYPEYYVKKDDPGQS